MQQGWNYAIPGQEQRTAQQQLPLRPEKQEIALLSDLWNFSPGKSQAMVVPKLDHPCGLGSQRCPTDQHQEPCSRHEQGILPPSQITELVKPWSLVFLFLLMFYL